MFARAGVEAPLDHVIELSGVGRATLYRNFPDRFALLEALYEESFALLEQLTAEYHGDRSGGFFRAIEAAVAQLTSYALLSEYWRSAPTGGEARMRARERVERMFAPLLAKAQAEGECRNNMTSGDVPHILNMLGAAWRGDTPAEAKAAGARALALLRYGLAP